MTDKDLPANLKYGFSIFPNGIGELNKKDDGKQYINLKFSVITSIVFDDESTEPLEVEISSEIMDLLSKKSEKVYQNSEVKIGSLSFDLPKKNGRKVFYNPPKWNEYIIPKNKKFLLVCSRSYRDAKTNLIQEEKDLNLINKDLSARDKHIKDIRMVSRLNSDINFKIETLVSKSTKKDIKPQVLYDPRNKIELDGTPRGIKRNKDLFDNIYKKLESTKKHNQLFNKISRLKPVSFNLKKYTLQKLGKSDRLGKNPTILDFISIFSHIVKEPSLSREFGLCHDFEISCPIEDLIKDKPKKVTIELKSGKSEADFRGLHVEKNQVLDTFSDYRFKKKIEAKELFYHGPSNYGVMDLDDEKYDLRWSKREYINELVDKVYSEDLWNRGSNDDSDFVKKESKLVEGIIVEYFNTVDGANSNPVSKEGILGYNILVDKKLGDNESIIKSICKRQTTILGLNENKCFEEEGWIDMNVEIEEGLKRHSQNKLFSWSGHNLCVPKLSVESNEDEEPEQKNNWISDEDEMAYLNNKGLKIIHNLVPGSNTMLSQSLDNDNPNKYKFLIKQVLGNGYTFPLNSTNEHELTVKGITPEWIHDENDGIFEISQDERPIDAPLIKRKIHRDKNDEKDIKIIFHGEHKKESECRKLLPPRIDFELLQLLGYLEPSNCLENGNKLSKEDYVKMAVKLAMKSEREGVSIFSKKINYLADPRGRFVAVVPGDFHTLNKDRKIVIKDLFNYKKGKKLYEEIKTIDIDISKSINNGVFDDGLENIGIGIEEGEELTYRFHMWSSKDEKYHNSKSLDKGSLRNFILSHPYTTIKVASVSKLPDLPVISAYSNLRRPSLSSNESKSMVFYDLKMNSDSKRQSLELLSAFDVYDDDGVSIPISNRENNDQYLFENEFSKELFRSRNSNILETEIYLNNFKIVFKRNQKADLDLIQENEFIWEFPLNEKDVLKLVFNKTSNEYELIINDLKSGINVSDAGLCEFKFVYEYSENDGVFLTINNTKVPLDVGLPSKQLTHKYLSLNKKLEHLFLYKLNGGLEFIYPDPRIEKWTHFVLRDEHSTKFISKEILARAQSRFQSYYEDNSEGIEFVSTSVEKNNLEILSNKKPSKPTIELTPVVHRQIFETKSELTSDRSFVLMIEIDRPWFETGNEEKLALIVSEDDSITENSCAIGRDITSGSGRMDGMITEYLKYIDSSDDADSDKDYFKKYLNQEIIYNQGKKYNLLPLSPFYNSQKDKWVVLLRFKDFIGKNYSDGDPRTFTKSEIYSAFIRIVTCRYQAKSSYAELKMSEFTSPKYIPFHGNRKVSIKKISQDSVKVIISNSNNLKIGSNGKSKSHFIVLLSKKLINNFLIKNQLNTDLHVVQVNSDKEISIKDRRHVYVFEFESFDNMQLGKDINSNQEEIEKRIKKGEWDIFYQNDLRLIYAEHLKLAH